MPAPSPAFIVARPAPLNPFTLFPYRRDIFPADLLLGPSLGSLAPILEPAPLPADPARKEAR